jgi:RimJ/RimL family protein N-acetyltransferase
MEVFKTCMDYLIAPERIDTPEFTIRSYQPGDGKMLFEAIDNSREHLRTYMPWEATHQTDDDSECFARRFRGHYLLADEFTLAIVAPDGQRILGGTGYHLRWGNLANRTAEVGMWLRADAVYQGLGAKVLKTLLEWGFTEWPWLKLIWRCDIDNRPSLRTAEKAGMRQEGLMRGDFFDPQTKQRRDTLYYGLTREEWQAASSQNPG